MKKLEMNMESVNEHMTETMRGLGVGETEIGLILNYLNLARIVGQTEGAKEHRDLSIKAFNETLGRKREGA
jgi:hypothetical protein